QVEADATRALAAIGGNIDPRVRIQELSQTEKSLVAIARALAIQADIFILDEPTASLPADEVERLFSAVRTLRDHGVGILYVSHRLDEIFQIADRLVVLRDGRMVGERAIDQTNPKELVQLIVGRPAEQVFIRADRSTGEAMLDLHNIEVEGAGPVSFSARKGEMIGLAGLRGAGQELIGQALFGLVPVLGGNMLLNGKPVTVSGPQEAIPLGICYVSGDRGISAATSLSIRENLFLNPRAIGRRLFHLRTPASEVQECRDLGDRFHINPNDPERVLETLSGGNQQKVVLGRWLRIGGRVLVLVDPTAGVDVGAKAMIYTLLHSALEHGNTVIIVSNDFEEIANVCNRAIVFNRGQVVVELGPQQLSIEALLHAASASEHAG
ncbi:MAG: sugar ABC transporter ATP-binding protein, partial [Deltaproteobacteria bacterium]|nr:sugar ABC transporter ATP-binding protein [Deltaproteobacteria bacterium]